MSSAAATCDPWGLSPDDAPEPGPGERAEIAQRLALVRAAKARKAASSPGVVRAVLSAEELDALLDAPPPSKVARVRELLAADPGLGARSNAELARMLGVATSTVHRAGPGRRAPATARAIRALRADPGLAALTNRELARMLGVGATTVFHARRALRLPPPPRRPMGPRPAPLADRVRRALEADPGLADLGAPEIGRRTGVSPTTASKVLRRLGPRPTRRASSRVEAALEADPALALVPTGELARRLGVGASTVTRARRGRGGPRYLNPRPLRSAALEALRADPALAELGIDPLGRLLGCSRYTAWRAKRDFRAEAAGNRA